MEEWKSIPGFPNYEASSDGRIRRVNRRLLKLEMGRRASDYPRVHLPVGGGKLRHVMVHVLVARAFIGECPPNYEHNHKDGNKRNARPDNLEFVTRSANQLHRYHTLHKIGHNRGSKHPLARLTETDVVAIRARRLQGLELKAIAAEFDISIPSVSMIVTRKTWRHI